MVDFRRKTICPKDAVGALFRRRREELGMSLLTAAKKTGIARHYIVALEEGHYGELPGLVYGKSFVRVYGMFLRLSVAPLLRAFADEYTAVRAARRSIAAPRISRQPRVLVTPFRVRLALATLLIGILGVYFGGEVVYFLRPPHLVVESPRDQFVTDAESVRVSGTTDPRAVLTVNDLVVTNAQGLFSTLVPLEQGLNTLHIRAAHRHGKENLVVRNVIRSGDGISLR